MKFAIVALLVSLAPVCLRAQIGDVSGKTLDVSQPIPFHVLPNDLQIINGWRWENALEVIPPVDATPSSAASPGRIAVSIGEPQPGDIVTRNFAFTMNGKWPEIKLDGAVQTVHYHDIRGAQDSVFCDNQIIRLQNGSLLAVKDGCTWTDLSPKPAWWGSQYFDGFKGIPPAGPRGGLFFFRSDAKGNGWKKVGVFDSGVEMNGDLAWPRFEKKGGGTDTIRIGDFDRCELYQDPWTQRIFATAWGGSGRSDYDSLSPTLQAKNRHYSENTYVIYSDDSGDSWKLLGKFPGIHAPLMMTSTPNGVTYFAYNEGYSIALRHTKLGDPNTLSEAKLIVDASGEFGFDKAAIANDRYWSQPVSISRIAATKEEGSRIRLAYTVLNQHHKQGFKFLDVKVVGDKTTEFTVKVEHVQFASSQKLFSMTHGTFIEPDFHEMKFPGSPAVFYWVESSDTITNLRPGQTAGIDQIPTSLSAKFIVFYKGYVTRPSSLSMINGLPRAWNVHESQGHYFAGGFFYYHKWLNYVPIWSESGQESINVISIHEDSLPTKENVAKAPQQLPKLLGGSSYKPRISLFGDFYGGITGIAQDFKTSNGRYDVSGNGVRTQSYGLRLGVLLHDLIGLSLGIRKCSFAAGLSFVDRATQEVYSSQNFNHLPVIALPMEAGVRIGFFQRRLLLTPGMNATLRFPISSNVGTNGTEAIPAATAQDSVQVTYTNTFFGPRLGIGMMAGLEYKIIDQLGIFANFNYVLGLGASIQSVYSISPGIEEARISSNLERFTLCGGLRWYFFRSKTVAKTDGPDSFSVPDENREHLR